MAHAFTKFTDRYRRTRRTASTCGRHPLVSIMASRRAVFELNAGAPNHDVGSADARKLVSRSRSTLARATGARSIRRLAGAVRVRLDGRDLAGDGHRCDRDRTRHGSGLHCCAGEPSCSLTTQCGHPRLINPTRLGALAHCRRTRTRRRAPVSVPTAFS